MKGFDLKKLSKHRAVLMGFAAILIMLYHTTSASDFTRLGVAGKIFSFGNAGVDIFLLLSGFGCFFSFSRKQDVRNFYTKRFKTILPVSTVCVIAFVAVNATLGISPFVKGILNCLRLGSDNPAWYIPFTLLMYLAFPLIYERLSKANGYCFAGLLSAAAIVVSLVLSKLNYPLYCSVEASLIRIPMFVLGAVCGKMAMNGQRNKWIWLALPGTVAAWMMGNWFTGEWEMVFFRLTRSGLGIIAVLALCCFIEHLENIFAYKWLARCGAMSLELYLIHNLTKSVFEACGKLDLQMYFLIVVLTVIVSIPVSNWRSARKSI